MQSLLRGDGGQAVNAQLASPAGLAVDRFGALYIAFLGRTNGPRAGWLLASLEPGFVVDRLRAAAGWRDLPGDNGGAAGGDGERDAREAVG